jgi:2-polyprenyl-6-methoxyphenol hydroxylase-like FAD-dependent oxidoreductase
MQVLFADGSKEVVDLLVGADGGFSSVRKSILHERDPSTAEARWLPDFMGMTGFYGISTPREALAETEADADMKESTHALWLDDGNLSVAPLPGGKLRWDLIVSEKNPPDPAGPVEPSVAGGSDSAQWEAAIMPGMYAPSSSVEILRKHAGIYHPVVGNFGKLLDSAERIIRSPLRQRVWTKEEIQCGNVVLIGDAARLMLPSSGQGTGFAVEDATVLANALLDYASPEEGESGIRMALEDYAALRVPRSKNMAYVAMMAGRVALGEQWYSRLLRDLGSRIMVGSDMK